MKAEFTSVTPSVAKVTLGDDSAKWTMTLEDLGGQGEEQLDALAFGTAVSRLMRGNLSGNCVFTSAKSHSDLDAAATFFATEYGRIGQQGTLELTLSAHKLVMVNATVVGVRRVEADEAKGVRWKLRYTFGVTTITYS
jgi:hypothetical protein